MTAGRRDHLVTFERLSITEDEYGAPLPGGWAMFAQEWAAIFWGAGSERRQAAMEQGSQAATFQVPSNETTRGLTIKDRITCEAGTFDITGIAPDMPKRGLIEITGVRAA